jgi:DedD protein
MDHGLKQRLIGAAVLVITGVVFIPILLDDPVQNEDQIEETNIPPRPEDAFASRIVPIEALEAPVSDEQPVVEAEPHKAPGSPDVPGSEGFDDDGLALLDTEASDAVAVDSEDQGEVVTNGEPASGQRVGVSAWVVQLGSFENKENALALEAKLKEQGYSAFIDSPPARAEEIFRVRVGPELLRSEATRLQQELKEKLALEAMVLRYP